MGRSDEELRQDVLGTIWVLGEDAFEHCEVSVVDGVARLTGRVDRRSTHRIALELAKRTPGVVDVLDDLSFEIDDERPRPPQRSRSKIPWATGPLVREH